MVAEVISELQRLANGIKNDLLNTIDTVFYGEIIVFEANKMLADVRIEYRVIDNATIIDKGGDAVGCPVLVNFNTVGGFKMPYKVGDKVICATSKYDFSAWHKTGDYQNITKELHNKSNMFVIGRVATINQGAVYDNNSVEFFYDGCSVAIKNNKVSIKNDIATLKQIVDNQQIILQGILTLLQSFIVIHPILGQSTTDPSMSAPISNIITQITSNQAKIDALLQ